jgi:hypothetical protein
MRDDKRCLAKLYLQSASGSRLAEAHAVIHLASLKAYHQQADLPKSVPSKRIDGTLVDHVANVKAAKRQAGTSSCFPATAEYTMDRAHGFICRHDLGA